MAETITPRTRFEAVYSDFHKDLAPIPGRGDIARRLNENAVRESIKNLILTDRGERLFQPNLGSDIRASLFENVTPTTIILLKDKVREVLNAYEPRCNSSLRRQHLRRFLRTRIDLLTTTSKDQT